MRRFLAALLCALVVTALSTPAHGCSCAEPPPPKEALQLANAVFVGRVIETRAATIDFGGEDVRGVVVTVAVDRLWKGPHKRTIKIVTGRGHGDCGFNFRTGQDYLVYAYDYWNGADHELRTDICTRTHELRDREEAEIIQLGEPETVFGNDPQLASSKELGATITEEPKLIWAFVAVAAASIAFVIGLVLGLAVGRRRARPLPRHETTATETGITAHPKHHPN
jgi:hypothetical protein